MSQCQYSMEGITIKWDERQTGPSSWKSVMTSLATLHPGKAHKIFFYKSSDSLKAHQVSGGVWVWLQSSQTDSWVSWLNSRISHIFAPNSALSLQFIWILFPLCLMTYRPRKSDGLKWDLRCYCAQSDGLLCDTFSCYKVLQAADRRTGDLLKDWTCQAPSYSLESYLSLSLSQPL